MCPELRTIDLSCALHFACSRLVNYINQSVALCFNEFCQQHSISLIDGGYPNFSLASLLPPTQPPVLIYRVITRMADAPAPTTTPTSPRAGGGAATAASPSSACSCSTTAGATSRRGYGTAVARRCVAAARVAS